MTMSDHAGRYLLREVLEILRRYRVFRHLGPKSSQRMVRKIVKRACDHYDCNAGEILEEEGERLGICYGCLATGVDLVKGLCAKCTAESSQGVTRMER